MRWSLALGVLLLAAGIALWPRGSSTPAVPRTQAPDLATLQEKAALDPCPAAIAGAGAPVGVLAGISVTCLGNGQPLPLDTALAGRDTLLNVWSHVCQPCRDELPALQEYAARQDAIQVLGIQVDGTPQAGLGLMIALGVRMPSVTDPDGTLRAALQAPAVLPLTYLVGADGTVRMVNPPVVFRSADEVAEVVRQYRAGL